MERGGVSWWGEGGRKEGRAFFEEVKGFDAARVFELVGVDEEGLFCGTGALVGWWSRGGGGERGRRHQDERAEDARMSWSDTLAPGMWSRSRMS